MVHLRDIITTLVSKSTQQKTVGLWEWMTSYSEVNSQSDLEVPEADSEMKVRLQWSTKGTALKGIN